MSKLSVISFCVLLSYVASYESSGENYEPEEFASECLTAHNYYRKLHGTPRLTLSNDLNIGAQKLVINKIRCMWLLVKCSTKLLLL